jgi:hypothetical protein
VETVIEAREVRRFRLVPMAVALVAMFVGLVWAQSASAASDPIASGTTTITLNKGLYKKLKKNGVKVLKVSPGRVKNRNVTLPVSSGSTVDPTTGAGTINHSGGFKFKNGKKTAAVKNLVLNTTNKSLKGKIGKKSLKIASISGVTFTRNGFGVDVKIGKIKLTGNAAKQLNKALIPPKKKSNKSSASASVATSNLFKGGQVLGSASNSDQPSTVAVQAGGRASLNTSAETVRKFSLAPPAGLGVRIVPISPAEAAAGPTIFEPILNFPIGGGTIAPDASAGTVQTTGGVNLVQDLGPGGKTTMTLNAIWIDLTTKVATVDVTIASTVDPQLNLGPLGRISIANINLTGATISSDPVNRTVSVLNATATLQAVTAATLTSVFGAPYDAMRFPHPSFAEGDPLGTFSFTVQTQ